MLYFFPCTTNAFTQFFSHYPNQIGHLDEALQAGVVHEVEAAEEMPPARWGGGGSTRWSTARTECGVSAMSFSQTWEEMNPSAQITQMVSSATSTPSRSSLPPLAGVGVGGDMARRSREPIQVEGWCFSEKGRRGCVLGKERCVGLKVHLPFSFF